MTETDAAVEQTPSQLRDTLSVVRLRKWTILFMTCAVVSASVFFSLRQEPLYRSTARVLVKPVFGTSRTVTTQHINLETERELATSSQVVELAGEAVGDNVGPEELRKNLFVRPIPNTEILAFEYEAYDPVVAQARAQAFAASYLENRTQQSIDDLLQSADQVSTRISDLNEELTDLQSQITSTRDETRRATLQLRANVLTGQIGILTEELSELTPSKDLSGGKIVEEATLPASPSSANPFINGAMGLILGIALGVGLAFLRERLDDRLRGRSDLEGHARAPVLAVVPKISHWRKKTALLFTALRPNSPASEAFRTLRTRLLYIAYEKNMKVTLVTSAHAGEGKSATAANLALVIAQTGRSVMLISADLRKPRAHHYFGLTNTQGIVEVLASNLTLNWRDVVVKPIPGLELQILPSGPVPGNPAELLGSDAMAYLLEELKSEVDHVIIDAAPVLAVSDALTLAPLSDGVLIVADAESTSRGAVSHTRQQLDEIGAEVIGAVLNKFDPAKARSAPYYYRYYSSGRTYEDHGTRPYPIEVVVRGNGEGRVVTPERAEEKKTDAG